MHIVLTQRASNERLSSDSSICRFELILWMVWFGFGVWEALWQEIIVCASDISVVALFLALMQPYGNRIISRLLNKQANKWVASNHNHINVPCLANDLHSYRISMFIPFNEQILIIVFMERNNKIKCKATANWIPNSASAIFLKPESHVMNLDFGIIYISNCFVQQNYIYISSAVVVVQLIRHCQNRLLEHLFVSINSN